jgi:FkbM family methyltransferase
MLRLIRTSTPQPIKDWVFASRQLADRESMRTYLRLRRIRRQVRNEEAKQPIVSSPPVAIRLKALRGQQFFVRPGTTDVDSVWNVLIRGREATPSEVTDPRIIVDVGANIGAVMAYSAVRFPLASIVGVEVDPRSADVCRRNIAPWHDRCTIINAAVWIKDEEVCFRRRPGYEWSTYVAGAGTSEENGEVARVRGITLNTLVHELGFRWIDYLNMYVNIDEGDLFASRTEWASRVGCIKVAAHYPADECARDLSRLGFQVLRIDRKLRTPRVIAMRSRPEA